MAYHTQDFIRHAVPGTKCPLNFSMRHYTQLGVAAHRCTVLINKTIMRKYRFCLLLILTFLQPWSTTAADFKVICQVTGFVETNCFLIYDINSKEAAIIDPGWRVDSIINFIKENNLNLKYIFLTHGHTDHAFYVPDVKKQFPKVKLCMNKIDYEKMFTQFEWFKENYGQAFIDRERSNPEHKAYMDFDPHSIGIPDIFIDDDQSFKLGLLEIRTIHTPGHSPGEICYYMGNVLFSGDVLFYRTVGGIHNQACSKEDLIKSVRKLYEIFPDSTIIYPGHGQCSDIGSEKRENKNISINNENIN